MSISLPGFCLETLSRSTQLSRIEGLDDLERVRLPGGRDGGGIKMYNADIFKATLVDFRLGDGVPVPHHDNRLCAAAEIFQIAPDLNYRLPAWGINSVIMKDGTYYFDTDFSFGFDLVTDYDFVQTYIAPFNETYREFTAHPDFEMVSFYESTPWVRTCMSPLFFSAVTTRDRVEAVCELAAAFIGVWMGMYRDAETVDAAGREAQEKRLKARAAGSKDSDRMGRVLLDAYGRETFTRFFRAMA